MQEGAWAKKRVEGCRSAEREVLSSRVDGRMQRMGELARVFGGGAYLLKDVVGGACTTGR